MQMQTCVAVAAAEQNGDHAFGENVGPGTRLRDTVHVPLGADANETTTFVAHGMLINCLTSMSFTPEHRVWDSVFPDARPTEQIRSRPTA